jgi:hypothetical protein
VLSGISDVANPNLKIYPNPLHAGGNWQLEAGEEWTGKEIWLTNVSGRLIWRHIIRGTLTVIPANALAGGVYFLKVASLPGAMKLVKD